MLKLMFSYYRSTCNCPTIVRDELAISNVAGWGPVEQNCQENTDLLEKKFVSCEPSCGHKVQCSQGLHPSNLPPHFPSPASSGWSCG